MTGSNTSISGVRSPSGSRRGDTRRVERRWASATWAVHIVIVGLAVLLWWIARDMVSVTQQLKDGGSVRFELDEALKGEWKVMSLATQPVSLEVSGPTKEINDFAAELDQNPGRFSYRYEINESDLANLKPDSRQQVVLTIDIRKFETTGDAVVPPELTVRPLGTGDRIFTVTLEHFITRPAYVDLGPSGKGQIQVTLPRGDRRNETRAYSYVAEVADVDLEVRGPASLVNANSDTNGLARLKVSIDAKQVLDNFAASKAKTVESVLDQGSIVSIVQLLPIEGVEVRDKSKGVGVAEVPVRVTYTRLQDYVQVSREFPVEIVFPNWLAQKGARVDNLPDSVPVDMKVLGSQRANFNEMYVHLRLDLSGLNRNEIESEIESVEGSTLKRYKLVNGYYSLDLDTTRLTYEFNNTSVTAENYQPIGGEMTIVWSD